MLLNIVVAILVGYLLGNLNGAVSMSVLVGKEDVRSKGSGNAGLTNFIRNFGGANAILVILIDAGKAVISCLAGGLLLESYGLYQEGLALGGLAVMLGHTFPALLGFRGGKGILSGFFVALMVDWRVAVVILAVFAVVYLISGYVSLSSVLAAAAFAIAFALLHWGNWFIVASGVFMGALAIFMHRSNIKRLINGTESKTNLFKKGNAQ